MAETGQSAWFARAGAVVLLLSSLVPLPAILWLRFVRAPARN